MWILSVVVIENGSPIDFSLEDWEVGSYPPNIVPAGFLARVDLGVALHGLSSDREDRNIVGEFLVLVLDVLVVLFSTPATVGLFFSFSHASLPSSPAYVS